MVNPSVDRLGRHLGLGSALALVIGEVLGVGIFLTPADMARSLGSPFWLLVVWLVMGLMAFCGALCYGELSSRFPEAGGGYIYLREAYGNAPAFMYGWKCLIVLDPGLTAALAVGVASYLAYATGLSPTASKAAAILCIAGIAAANIRGVRYGAGILRGFTLLKLGLLATLILWGFVFRLGNWGHFSPFVAQHPGSAPLSGALAGGMVAAFFSFGGWWDAAKLAGEVRDPSHTLPRALGFGVAIVTLVYILTSAAFLYLVPIEAVTSGEAFAGQAGQVLFGAAGGKVFAAVVLVCVVSSMAGFMMAAPRVYYAMAKDRVFLSSMGALHPRFDTPHRAILLQAALAILLVLFSTFSKIVAYFIFVTVLFVALTVAAVFVLRRRSGPESSYRTPGYPITPLVFLALVAVLLFLLAMQNPLQAGLGVAVVALGWPVYTLGFRNQDSGIRRGDDT